MDLTTNDIDELDHVETLRATQAGTTQGNGRQGQGMTTKTTSITSTTTSGQSLQQKPMTKTQQTRPLPTTGRHSDPMT